MRLLTKFISACFLPEEADFLFELDASLGSMGSHSNIGVPDMTIRCIILNKDIWPEFPTTQLIVVALPSIDMEKYGAIQQQVDHHALAGSSQELKKLRPWCPLDGSNPLVEVQTEDSLDRRLRCLLSRTNILAKTIAKQMARSVARVPLPRK